MRNVIKPLASNIKNSKHLVTFTGAGISSESGIPTYRGKKGLWRKYDPNLYANINYFLQDPSYYWNFFREVRYPMLKKVKPNKAHLALAEMLNYRGQATFPVMTVPFGHGAKGERG